MYHWVVFRRKKNYLFNDKNTRLIQKSTAGEAIQEGEGEQQEDGSREREERQEMPEYDSDSTDSESGEDAEIEDWVSGADAGVPTVPKETLFLVGGRSRFGRAVRINNKYL